MLPFPIITPYSVPVSDFQKAQNGESHLLLLKNDGNLYGSGSNNNSQLNQSTGTGTGSYNTFVLVDTGVLDVWAGDNSTFWTSSDGNLYFCGLQSNSTSLLYSTGLKTAIQLPSGITVQDISKIRVIYDSGVCLITTDGRAFCHGTNVNTTFRPYVDTSTGVLSSYTYFDDSLIPSTWVEVSISGGILVKDFQLNTSFGSSSASNRHSGTFVGTDNNMYRYLNAGWNNFTFTSAYYPNYSFYKCDSTSVYGFNYNLSRIVRNSNQIYTNTLPVQDDLYYVLNSYGSLTSTAYSSIQANPENLTQLVCLRPSNGGSSTLSLEGNIIGISGRTTLYSILTSTSLYLLTKAGILSTIDFNSIT